MVFKILGAELFAGEVESIFVGVIIPGVVEVMLLGGVTDGEGVVFWIDCGEPEKEPTAERTNKTAIRI